MACLAGGGAVLGEALVEEELLAQHHLLGRERVVRRDLHLPEPRRRGGQPGGRGHRRERLGRRGGRGRGGRLGGARRGRRALRGRRVLRGAAEQAGGGGREDREQQWFAGHGPSLSFGG